MSEESVAARLRQVRESLGVTQLQFLAVLNREAAKIGAREYTQSTLSKIESGTQAATFDDVAVFAAADKERRGKLWLAWGEQIDGTLAGARAGPSIIQENEDEVFDEPTVPEKKPVRRRRGA